MHQELVSVEQARALIAANLHPVFAVRKNLSDSIGLSVAEDIFSSLDIPSFDQSSMDGYAIHLEDISELLLVQGTIPAGNLNPVSLSRNHAMQIFTGAPLPAGANTVIMQEKVSVEPPYIKISDQSVAKGTHVRKQGSELKKGELVLKMGTTMSAPVIGLLASLGITEVTVYPGLSISVIATGSELQKPGKDLQPGHVYESNTFFLSAALSSFTREPLSILYAEDKLEVIQEMISQALQDSDIILITGGVSVGDYDFVKLAADNNSIQCLFHKVKQRPGKPLYFGIRGKTLVFGLPGNPASVITCFYEYVLPAIRFMMHLPRNETETAVLKNDFRKAEGLTQFLKGYIDDCEVEILGAQESYRLRSFARANCLVCLDENRLEYEKGEKVVVRRLPIKT